MLYFYPTVLLLLCAITFSVTSFFVFMSALHAPLLNEADDVDWTDSGNKNESIAYLETSTEETYEMYLDENDVDEVDELIEVYEEPGIFKKIFSGIIIKQKKNSFALLEEEFEDSSTDDEEQEDEFIEEILFKENTEEQGHEEEEDNIDKEFYDFFPHEKSGITIFSKEDISDVEIGDLKELVLTIKEELTKDKVINIDDFLGSDSDIVQEKISKNI